MAKVEHRVNIENTKDTPYFALMRKYFYDG